MSRSAKQGFLVVADITGYTAYLSDSELEHAKDVLKVLLDLLIDHTRAPLAVSGLEGDAVLSYSIDSDRFEAQAFVEIIEQTYVSFKRAIELMVMNTSCECNACANIGNLDLKFFAGHLRAPGLQRGRFEQMDNKRHKYRKQQPSHGNGRWRERSVRGDEVLGWSHLHGYRDVQRRDSSNRFVV